MLVLHAIWAPANELWLWAEDGALPASAPGRPGRPPKVPRPRAHPFAAGIECLKTIVSALAPPDGERAATLLLPSQRNAPQPSPGLLREASPGDGEEPVGLAPWSIPCVALGPSGAIDALLAAGGDLRAQTGSVPGGGAGPAVVAGESVAFLGEVAKLALELVARGRLLPGLEPEGDSWRARWRPLPDADDLRRVALLVRGLPPVLRALAREDGAGLAAAAIVDDALAAMVDAAARDALEPGTLNAPARGAAGAARRAWLGALNGAGPSVSADPRAVGRLAAALDAWAADLRPAVGPLRTCFRLGPPGEDAGRDAPWRLDVLLQATDDPSLTLDARAVWESAGDELEWLSRRLESPHERLLEDLARAARLHAPLERALHAAAPDGLDLDVHEAHAFLREGAPLLEQAGFGVLLPGWWRSGASQIGARLRLHSRPAGPKGEASGLLGLDGICAYDWELAIGDEPLSVGELRRLARLKVPLVRVRGQWVELRREELERALTLLARRRDEPGEITVRQALRVGIGLEASEVGLPVIGVQGDGPLGALLDGAGDTGQGRRRTARAPRGFTGKLRPYQRRGLAWLRELGELGLGACLADDMGLGKTVQLLALLLAEREDTPAPEPTLLMCPMSVLGNWEREARRFAPALAVHVHHGRERIADADELAEAAAASDLVLTTYTLAARDAALLGGVAWGRVVLDEAQAIKNPAAEQARAIRALGGAQRVALTGTPVENRLTELWSIMEFLNPGLLGSLSAFQRTFARPVERYGDDAAADRLGRLTRPFLLRRLKTDRTIIRDLPEKIEMTVHCTLTPEQATLYQAVVDDMLERIESSDEDGIERKGLVLATMVKLKQVCNHPAHLLGDGSRLDGRSGKLARLQETLEEAIAEGDRAICFTQFAAFGHRLRDHLRERLGVEVLYLHGATPKRARDELVARFQSDGGPPILLLSLKAGGSGLNLTAASHVIHFDRWWNPAVEDQATDRAYRIGQRRDVQVRKLVCAGTLEERIDELIERKRALAQRIVGSGETWLTELSPGELRELITLSAGTEVAA